MTILLLMLLVPAAMAQSPASRAIASAERQIALAPHESQPYNYLARALVRRARETGDPAYFERAERAIADSLRVEPDNFEALKARVTALLGRRDYTAALELAKKLNRRIPDDVAVYGYIADACIALEDYKQAETAAQWMLDLRRGSLPGMIRGAMLRGVWGDTDGAIDWLTSVYRLTSPSEVEERAWLLTHIADLRRRSGKLELAAQAASQALALFPDYYFALEALAEARTAEGRHADAADLWKRAHGARPRPEYLDRMNGALQRAGEPGATR